MMYGLKCTKCEYAKRDNRGRYIEPCSGYANCDFSEYKGTVDMTEEEKDKLIQELSDKLEVAEGTKRRLTIFDRISIVTETEQRVAKEIIELIINSFPFEIKDIVSTIKDKYKIKD